MKKLYDVVSKATKINKITGAEIPAEVFHGPYTDRWTRRGTFLRATRERKQLLPGGRRGM